MDNVLRAALVWGTLCFLLLYRSLPADIALWWQLYQQTHFPLLQVVASASIPLLPASVPLVCFLLFRQKTCRNKALILAIPLFAWLVSRFAILAIVYFISVKSGNVPPYAESFASMFNRMLTSDWLIGMSVSALTIIACSYAFWRETRASAQ